MRRVRALVLALTLASTSAAAAQAARADVADADPFKARMAQNLGLATRVKTTLEAQAKRKAPKGLSVDQRKGYAEQTRWLAETAARFAAMKARMEAALAKPKGSSSEVAQLNIEFGNLRDKAEAESRRFEAVAPACRARHEAALAALKF